MKIYYVRHTHGTRDIYFEIRNYIEHCFCLEIKIFDRIETGFYS